MMTPKEKFIAQAALKVAHSTRLEQLYSSMSAATAIDHDELKPIVQQLVAEGILKVCTTSARDTAGVDPPQGTKEVWYEKDERWKG
jgi:competence protein ComGC